MNLPYSTGLVNLCWKACRSCQDDYFYFFGWHLAEPTIKWNENSHQCWIYWIFCSRAQKPCTLFFLIRHIMDIYYPLSRKKLLWSWRRLQKLFNKEEIKQMRVGLHSKPGVPSGSWSGPLRCTRCFIRTWIPERLSWNIKPGGGRVVRGRDSKGRRLEFKSWLLTPDSSLSLSATLNNRTDPCAVQNCDRKARGSYIREHTSARRPGPCIGHTLRKCQLCLFPQERSRTQCMPNTWLEPAQVRLPKPLSFAERTHQQSCRMSYSGLRNWAQCNFFYVNSQRQSSLGSNGVNPNLSCFAEG